MRFLIVVLASLTLAACQSSGPIHAAFDPQEAAFIKKKGAGAITGHAFLKRRSGINVYASGEVIRLTPVTAYSKERFARIYGARKFASAIAIPRLEVDPVYASYTRTVKADHMGRFRFDNVAPGRYFVSTQVTWSNQDDFFSQGGAMYDVVEISGREDRPVDVILSGN